MKEETKEVVTKIKRNAEGSVKKGILFGFCPGHLEIERRPELWVFPQNIMFMKFRGGGNEPRVSGQAVYDPDLSTFHVDAGKWSMTYRNQYGGNHYVIIRLVTETLSYSGEKYVEGRLVGSADGIVKGDANEVAYGWNMFFVHLTMLGLTNGERCLFSPVEKQGKGGVS